jgi:hypothetical protein
MTEGLPFGIEWPFASMQSDRQRFRHVSIPASMASRRCPACGDPKDRGGFNGLKSDAGENI